MKGVNFITDDKNRKKAVVISLKMIEERQEELEDLLDAIIAESRKDEPKRDWKEVKAALKEKGKALMYRVVISRTAEKELTRLPKKVLISVGVAIDSLEENPRPVGCKKLKGSDENLWRIRVGDYRIIYAIADEIKIVEVRKVGHRKDVYE